MFIFTYTAALISILFIVSAAVLFVRKRDAVHLALIAYLLTSALWVGGNAAADVSYTPGLLILTSQLAYSGGVLNLFFCILLVDLLVDRTLPNWKRVLAYCLPCVAMAILGFFPDAITDISFPPGQPAEIVPGDLYSFTIYMFLIGLAYCIIRLVRTLQSHIEYTRRMQLLYVLAGLIIVSAGELAFDLILPVSGELRLYSLGPVMSLFFAAGCSYAITRHRLLDIRIIAQRSIIYSILFAGIAGVYIALLTAADFFLTDPADTTFFLSGGITVILGIFGIPVLERYFRSVTDSFLFKDTYDYAEAMLSLSRILQTAALDELVQSTEQELTRILRATSVQIYLSAYSEDTANALCVPIHLHEEQIGTICVGERRSGEPYAIRDFQFLTTFANQAATALSRVRLYTEIQGHAQELEQKVEQRTAALRAMQEEQQRMMMDLSHNLQTPLTILRLKIDRLREGSYEDKELMGINQSISNLSQFISDLLALTAFENALEQEPSASFSLSAVCEDIAEEMRIITASRRITIISSVAPSITYTGNQKRLREALMNLMNNAVKYMGNGSKKQITLSLAELDGTVEIVIEDTGIGIAPEDVERIFERFYRVAPSKSDVRGTGLGLAIVKQIVEQHRGSLRATSTLGVGSRFTLALPYYNEPIPE
jgi:signal transduction histidine kinase